MPLTSLQLRRRIMGRVYTAAAAKLITNPIILNGALFLVGLATFTQLVHVRRVVDAALSLPLSRLPQFIVNTIMHGEVLTLLAISVMVFSALSLNMRLGTVRLEILHRQVV